ncbi:MAG: bile acid:sodium symporter [Verrucomicrobiales bacterium]|nr:bile acid:sodium symporter [Verrucomicrobiales bacterium]
MISRHEVAVEQSQIISLGINAIVLVTMVIVGLDVTLSEFRDLLKQPKPILTGLISLTLFVPISITFVHLTDLPAHLEAGILLLAICPTGSIANVYASVGQANLALSITLAIATGLLAFITMPLWIAFYGTLPGDVFEFQVPASMLFTRLFFVLALPIALGMWVRSTFPAFERRFHQLLKRIALVGVVTLGGYIIFSDGKGFSDGFVPTVLSATVLTVLGMAGGFLIALLFRLERRDSITLLLISPVKNFGVAIAIAVSILHQTEFALFATTMFMAQLPLLLGAALLLRRFVKEAEA